MKSLIKKILLLLALSALISSCRNTMEGVGQDVERVGQRIEDKAR